MLITELPPDDLLRRAPPSARPRESMATAGLGDRLVDEAVATTDATVDPREGHVHHNPNEDDDDHHGHHHRPLALGDRVHGAPSEAEGIHEDKELPGHQRVPRERPALLHAAENGGERSRQDDVAFEREP